MPDTKGASNEELLDLPGRVRPALSTKESPYLVQVGQTTQTAAKIAAARMGEAAPRMETIEPLALSLMDRYLGQ